MNSILLVNRPKLSRLHGYLYVRSILHNISKFGIYAAEIPNSDSFTVDIVDLSAVSSQISSRVFSAELLSTSRVATLLATAVEERISAQLKELFGIDDKENLQVLEERLRTQLKEESGYNESSSEYKKYWTRIPEVAQLYVKTFTVRAVHELQEELQVNFLDAPFEFIGRKWLLVEQYDEALAAFTKSVEISKREGPWWPQILCARHCYLAFVQAILGKKKQQLRTSLMGAAFAVAFKNSALETDLASSMLFNCSLFNLFIYLLDCKIDQQSWYDFHASVIGPFQKQMVQLCQMDKLDMNQDVVRVTQPGSVSCWKDFAVEVLKVATLEVPSKFPGWFLSWPFSARLPFLGYPFGEINGEVIPHAYPCIEIEELELPVPGGRQAESSSGPSSIPAREAHIEEVERVVYAFNSRLKMGTERGAALEELAHTGRDLAFWVRSAWTSASSASTSASTAASIPPENIRLTLVRLHTFSTILMIHKRVDLSKTMLQDLIMWLLDQTNFQFKEECLDLLVDYSEICALTYDREEQMNCCRKGLTLAKADRLLFWQFRFHLKLADFYLCMSNATQAEEELVSARHVMTQTSEPAKDELFMAQLEGMLDVLPHVSSHNEIFFSLT
ncbi:hypothetical protein R1sor_000683 [Riccia sorocarpa]|uniref:Uncharacterized protein n=1 Tax=Riccia sorocarpa TaxID=122646 RepID=A0ABD3GXZ9_9MARC